MERKNYVANVASFEYNTDSSDNIKQTQESARGRTGFVCLFGSPLAFAEAEAIIPGVHKKHRA
jgi:hypothetical protein